MVIVLPKTSIFQLLETRATDFLSTVLVPLLFLSVPAEASGTLIFQSQFIFLNPDFTTPISFLISPSLPVHGGVWPALPPPFLPFRLTQPISQGLHVFPGLVSEQITRLGSRSRAHPESQIHRWNSAAYGWTSYVTIICPDKSNHQWSSLMTLSLSPDMPLQAMAISLLAMFFHTLHLLHWTPESFSGGLLTSNTYPALFSNYIWHILQVTWRMLRWL